MGECLQTKHLKLDWHSLRREGSEQCDDGSRTPGDGCSPNCQLEPGWLCATRVELVGGAGRYDASPSASFFVALTYSDGRPRSQPVEFHGISILETKSARLEFCDSSILPNSKVLRSRMILIFHINECPNIFCGTFWYSTIYFNLSF